MANKPMKNEKAATQAHQSVPIRVRWRFFLFPSFQHTLSDTSLFSRTFKGKNRVNKVKKCDASDVVKK